VPDFQLIAKSALTPGTEETIGAYAIREVSLSIASVAALDTWDTDAAFSAFLGFDAPNVAKWSEAGAVAAFWTGAGQWFVSRAEAEAGDLATDLQAALGAEAAITDQSGGWAGFDVSGPNLTAVLEKLVGFDVGGASPGEAHRTSIEHISSFVLCKSATEVRIFCPRSFAHALHHAVAQAVRSQLALEK